MEVEVVDPRYGGLGVIMAIFEERGAPGVVVGAVEGAPVSTDGASVVVSVGGTCTWVIGVTTVLPCEP